jgi:hypothetical protein
MFQLKRYFPESDGFLLLFGVCSEKLERLVFIGIGELQTLFYKNLKIVLCSFY